jgi:hypothetical protein
VTRHPSSLPGVPRDRFPRLVGVLGCSDFLPPLPLRFGCPSARRYHGAPAASLRRLRGTAAVGLEVVHGVPRAVVRGDGGTSQVPGVPSCCVPRSQTPVGRPLLARTSGPILSAGVIKPSTPRQVIFRGSITRPTTSLSTLRGRPRDRVSRKTRFWSAGWALTRRDFRPLGTSPSFQGDIGFSFPAGPGFSWRTKTED